MAKSSAGSVGRRGENIASRYLARRGYRIIARNWRSAVGEIDIVAQERRTIVIVEVKTLRAHTDSLWRPEDHLTAEKIRRLHRLGRIFCRRELVTLLRSRARRIRYDAVMIELPRQGFFQRPEIRHLRGLRTEGGGT